MSGEEVDAEIRTLLICSSDLATDVSARQIAGLVFWMRCRALGEGQGEIEGAIAGTLLVIVWAADESTVPEELAAGYRTDLRPEDVTADGPDLWHAHVEPRVEEFQRTGQRLNLSIALAHSYLAVMATPESHPRFRDRLADYACVLFEAARAYSDTSFLERAITVVSEALRRTADDDPAWAPLTGNLSLMLNTRFDVAGDPGDQEAGARLARDVLERTGERPPESTRYTSEFAEGTLPWRQLRARAIDHDQFVDLFREAATDDDLEESAHGALQLGRALLERFDFKGHVQDLNEAINVLRQALAEPSADPGRRAIILADLGRALHLRCVRLKRPEDGEESVGLLREAHESTPEIAAGTAMVRMYLALSLRGRFTRTARVADLQEAVSLARRAADAVSAQDSRRPFTANMLGFVLLEAHVHNVGGEDELLEHAIAAFRESVDRTPEGDRALEQRLINLASALTHRFLQGQDSTDLAQAQQCRRRAVEIGAGGYQGEAAQARRMSVLGIGLMRQADHAGDTVLMDEAIELLRQALLRTPDDDPAQSHRRLNLACCLLNSPPLLGLPGRIDEAIELLESALRMLPESAADRGRYLSVLGSAKIGRASTRIRPRIRQRALEEAVAIFEEAVRATPAAHLNLPTRLWNLGSALLERHRLTRDSADLTEAARMYRRAAELPSATPSTRAEAARAWGQACAELGDWTQALRGFTLAVEQLPAIAPRSLLRNDQEHWLSGFGGLAAEAAACAVQTGDPALAARLLEQGRGVLLAQTFDTRSDLTVLRRRAPDLADHFERLRDALDTVGSELEPESEAGAAAGADHRNALAAEWDALLVRIRALPGMDGFLYPPGDLELRAGAADGPVVLVNVTSYRSDALAITPDRIRVIPLPALTPAMATKLSERFAKALRTLNAPNGATQRQATGAQNAIQGVLAQLWDIVVEPVLDELGLCTAPAEGQVWPRVWWSPGAPLSTLPLHAAGHQGDHTRTDTPNVLDRVVSSYTPIVRALLHARTQAGAQVTARPRLLVIAVPEAEGAAPLAAAQREVRSITKLVPESTIRTGPAATYDTVVTDLPGHAFVHFACHAIADTDHPSRSRLILHDHRNRPLTVPDIARLRLNGARLAYLSACSTHRTSPELADESIHIVSAFQLAGYAHVVGSLWEMDDTAAARTARGVYQRLRKRPGTLDEASTAIALHETVREMRHAFPHAPSLWAGLIHAGA
ncbi:CHAT domain-containing protein [Actinomadura rubrisoli]|uniref:CHAT domain-containing protein n=1 Tax=Actinomadura rubrisoli TaxID=2530368 RepID=UPI0014053186|nr:CHAT domain-containing protein [Actinomadura rubrisoli]